VTADGTPITPSPDFSSTPVTATFRVYAAGCGSTCSTTALWTSAAISVDNAGGASTLVAVPLADDAYVVTVDLKTTSNYVPERTVAAFAIYPGSSTYVVGGGNLNPQWDGTVNDAMGYFGFNIKKAKNSAIGSFVYSYRVRIDPTATAASPATKLNPVTCDNLSASCRDVDVIVRSTSLTSASTTQSSTWPVTGTATGKVLIQYVDAITPAVTYNLAPSNNLTFRYDAFDAGPGGDNDTFGVTIYSTAQGTTSAYHWAAGTKAGQTGTSATTTMARIAPVGDPTSNADVSAPPGNKNGQ
jgi:hypothetical protein